MDFEELKTNDISDFGWRLVKVSDYLFEWHWEIDVSNNEWYTVAAQYQPDSDEIYVSAATYNERRGMGYLINAQDYSSTVSDLESALDKVSEYINKIEEEQP